jgi:CCR4-NOT transcription complex subunit 7/8
VYKHPSHSYYESIKQNVDDLKVIQIGLTLCDENGNYPPGTTTWQFNFKFDLDYDKFSPESIELLERSGINFDQLKRRGISMEKFGEYLMTSGFVLNEDVFFVSFHGCYDFAYLIKILTNLPLPDSESMFFETLKTYFPNYYDIRYLVRLYDHYRGSLQRLANELDICRYGTQHQAGSDSIVTKEVFFNLKNNSSVDIHFIKEKNILFGFESNSSYNNVGLYGSSYNDDKFDPNYMILNNNTNLNNHYVNFQKPSPNNLDYNSQFFPINHMNYQYMNFRGNQFANGSNMMVNGNLTGYR